MPVGEHGVEGGGGAPQVALAVADPPGEQQRAGCRPAGGGRALGQLPRPGGHLGGGLAVAGVESGPAELAKAPWFSPSAGRVLPPALARRPQRLHREQRVPAGPLQHRGGQLGHAGAPGQLGDGGRRQRPELQHAAGAGQGGQRLRALLGADGGHHQQAVAGGPTGQPAHQEVEQLDG